MTRSAQYYTKGRPTSYVLNKASAQKGKADPGSDATARTTGRRWSTRHIVLTAAVVATAAFLHSFASNKETLRFLSGDPVKDGGEAFHVVELPGRGKGIIALRDIKQGELLIKEKPLVVVPTSTNQDPAKILKDRLNVLTQSAREEYYSLSYVAPGRNLSTLSDDDVTLAILQTNAISAGDSVGLFPRTARMNHGCSAAFNSVYSWRSRGNYLVTHALKPIKRGEELLTTYTDTKKPRHERQHYLKSYYDFTCSCSVCSLPDEESVFSDQRLSRMASLGQSFAGWGQGRIDGIKASRIAKEIWELGEKEGYWSERGRLAADVAHIAAAHADEEAVLTWAAVAQTWYADELGNDSAQVLETQALLRNPRSHFAWGTRQPQSIELPITAS